MYRICWTRLIAICPAATNLCYYIVVVPATVLLHLSNQCLFLFSWIDIFSSLIIAFIVYLTKLVIFQS